MSFIKSVWAFLKGKKTYIIGCLMILLGWLRDDTSMILEGFGFITLRKGVKDAIAR